MLSKYTYDETANTVTMSAQTFAELLCNQRPDPDEQPVYCTARVNASSPGIIASHGCQRVSDHDGHHFNDKYGKWAS